MTVAVAPPGWYPDPWGVAALRWWDGVAWLGYTHDLPVAAPPAPVAPPSRRGFMFRAPTAPGASADRLRGGVVAFVGFLVANAFSVAAALGVIALGSPRRSVTTVVAGLAGLWLGLALTVRIVARRNRLTLGDLGLGGAPGPQLATGAVGGAVGWAVAAQVAGLLWILLPHGRTTTRPGLDLAHQPDALGVVVLVLCICVGAPFFEELYFRGVVQPILTRRIGPGAAVLTQAFLFGCIHYQVGMTATITVVTVATITVAGIVLGWLRWHFARLAPSMVAHATFNLVTVLITLGAART